MARHDGSVTAAKAICMLTAYFVAVVQTWYAQHRLYWTPSPLGRDAPGTAFSEARAMAHTFHLASTIGDRQARLEVAV